MNPLIPYDVFGVTQLACIPTTTTAMSTEPPPTYSQEDASDISAESGPDEPQILIIPPSSGLSFQKGFLGADGERAAIEGEVLIKGATSGRWRRVYVVCTLTHPSSG